MESTNRALSIEQKKSEKSMPVVELQCIFSGCIPQTACLHAPTPFTSCPVPHQDRVVPYESCCANRGTRYGVNGVGACKHAFWGMQPERKHCNSTTSRAFPDFFCASESAGLALSNHVVYAGCTNLDFGHFWRFLKNKRKMAQKGRKLKTCDRINKCFPINSKV